MYLYPQLVLKIDRREIINGYDSFNFGLQVVKIRVWECFRNQKTNSCPTCFPQSLSEVASTVKHWSTVSLLRLYVMYAFKENSTLWFFYSKYQQYVTFKTIFTVYLYLLCCWELDENINTALIHPVKNIRLCTKTSVKKWFYRRHLPDYVTVLSFLHIFFWYGLNRQDILC